MSFYCFQKTCFTMEVIELLEIVFNLVAVVYTTLLKRVLKN